MFKKILSAFMCMVFQNAPYAGDVQDANKDLRYRNYSEVKKWVGYLNPKRTQKTRVIYKKAPEGRQLPKSQRARILPKGAKFSRGINFKDDERLLFNYGGELNFLNDFFSNSEHKGYPLDTIKDSRKEDFSNGIQMTPEKSSSSKHPILNPSCYTDRRFFYAFERTRTHFLAYYKEAAFEKIYTPAIAYIILPSDVPYAQDNAYEAALSWKDKEKIEGLYVISPFYQEKNQEIIKAFGMLGVDLPAEEAELLKRSKTDIKNNCAHLVKFSSVFEKNNIVETQGVITQESAQILKQKIEKILKRKTDEIQKILNEKILEQKNNEIVKRKTTNLMLLSEFRKQKAIENEIEEVIKRQIEGVIKEQIKAVVNRQDEEGVKREIERIVEQAKKEIVNQQVEEIVKRQEYLNALHPITECVKKPLKKNTMKHEA